MKKHFFQRVSQIILKNHLQNQKSYDTITKLFRDYNNYILK